MLCNQLERLPDDDILFFDSLDKAAKRISVDVFSKLGRRRLNVDETVRREFHLLEDAIG